MLSVVLLTELNSEYDSLEAELKLETYSVRKHRIMTDRVNSGDRLLGVEFWLYHLITVASEKLLNLFETLFRYL